MEFLRKYRNVILSILGIFILALTALFIFKGLGSKEFKITFETDNGTGANSLIIEKNKTIKKPEDPTKEGYEFAGWYLDGKLFDFNTKVTKDITLEAKWTPKEEETSLTLESTKITLTVGESDKIVVKTTGDIREAKLKWTSSDENIVSVDDNGNLKALKEGNAAITVTTEDGKYSAECTINVVEKEQDKVLVEKITITGDTTVEAGKTITLKVTIEPSNATNKKVTWTSSNKKIATIDGNGKVKGIKEGEVTIIVKSSDGAAEAKYIVTVTKKVEQTGSQVNPGTTTEPEKPQEQQPSEQQPSEQQPSEQKPSEQQPGETNPGQDQPSKPEEQQPQEPKEDLYVLYLKPKPQTGSGKIEQYTYRITKNGTTLNDYSGFIYNGHTTRKNAGSVQAKYVEGATSKTAELYLTDDSSPIKMTVVIEEL